MNKRQVERVKGDVIGYIIPRTSSEWQVIENACQKSWSKNGDELSIILLWNFAILHFYFGITSHSLTKHVFSLFLCCSEVRRCLAFHFWQNILIELQHAIKANQPRQINSILISEMTRCLLKWYGVTKQILSSYMKLNHSSCS
jgi:hypothetical protein